MNKLVTLFLLAGSSVSTAVFADATPDHGVWNFDESADYYSQLLEMFDKGQPATFADVEGWRSGRCYYETARDKPYGALIVGERRQVPGDHGPLFPPQFQSRVLGFEAEEPNFYDNLDQRKEKLISAAISSSFDAISDSVEKDGALCSKDRRGGGFEYQIRKSDEYIFVKKVPMEDPDSNKVRAISRTCYFFKKAE